MLATLIQRYDKKNHFTFDPVQDLKFYGLSSVTFYIHLYPVSKSFLDDKMSILEPLMTHMADPDQKPTDLDLRYGKIMVYLGSAGPGLIIKRFHHLPLC